MQTLRVRNTWENYFLNHRKKGMTGHSNKETEKGKVQQYHSLNASP